MVKRGNIRPMSSRPTQTQRPRPHTRACTKTLTFNSVRCIYKHIKSSFYIAFLIYSDLNLFVWKCYFVSISQFIIHLYASITTSSSVRVGVFNNHTAYHSNALFKSVICQLPLGSEQPKSNSSVTDGRRSHSLLDALAWNPLLNIMKIIVCAPASLHWWCNLRWKLDEMKDDNNNNNNNNNNQKPIERAIWFYEHYLKSFSVSK